MADLNNPTQVSLGRVSAGGSLVRSTTPFVPADDSAITGLLKIGNSIAGGLIKEQKRKEFYEGQDRILQASLEGTQKETLQTILEDQPYYMKIMGNGAVADGAVEMASRVGAGRMFDQRISRLATGQDIEINPELYKSEVMQEITSQRTGNEEVDSIFMPQMIAKGQQVIATHMQKHLEHVQHTAMVHSIEESDSAINTLLDVVKAEYKDPTATFVEGVSVEAMPPAIKGAYYSVVNSFNPEYKPQGLEEEGWLRSKLALAIPTMEQGNTAVFQAIQESGLYNKLSADDRAKVHTAQAKGKVASDNKLQMKYLPQEIDLTEAIYNAKSDADVAQVYAKATKIAKQYDKDGITRPDDLKDEKIKSKVLTAAGNVQEYLRAMRAKQERLAETTASNVANLEGQDKFMGAILSNSLQGFPMTEVRVQDSSGNEAYVAPTEKDLKAAYARKKSDITQSGEAGKKWLESNGMQSVEALAFRMGVVDEGTKKNVSTALRMASGIKMSGLVEVKGKVNQDVKKVDIAVGSVAKLVESLPKAAVLQYAEDEGTRADLSAYLDGLEVTGNYQMAWDASFGRDKTMPVEYDREKLDKALANNKFFAQDVEDFADSAGHDKLAVKAWVRVEAVAALSERRAQDPKEAVASALQRVAQYSESLGDTKVLGVPPEYTVAARTKLPSQTAGSLTDIYAKSLVQGKYGDGYSFSIDFVPSSQKHYIIPRNPDEVYLMNMPIELDYAAVTKLLVPENLAAAEQRGAGKFKKYLDNITKSVTKTVTQGIDGKPASKDGVLDVFGL